MTQEEISIILSKTNFKNIVDSNEFYFQKGQDALNKWINLSVNDTLKLQLIDLGEDYNKLKQIHNGNNLELNNILDLLFEITSYCDLNASEKVKYNKYEDNRTIARAAVRMGNWMSGLIKFKFNKKLLSGGSILNAFNYLIDPVNNTTVLSEYHKSEIIVNYFKKEYNPVEFINDLKVYFNQFNISVKNPKNYSHIISLLIYSISKEWKEEVVGLMASYNDNWQDNRIEELLSYDSFATWNSKKPVGSNKTINFLKRNLNESESFPIYYQNDGFVNYKAEIIDFAESQNDLDKKKWGNKYNTLLYFNNFSDYNTGNKFASIVFLAKSIEKINPIPIENFEFYEDNYVPREDSLTPIKSEPIIEPSSTSSPHFFSKEKKVTMRALNSLNTILYGPPGTGKTYNSINKAISIVNSAFNLKQDRKIIKEEYDRLEKDKRIFFSTFHQSMSYEDFIEGIKPLDPKDGESLSYGIKSGIFKIACARAAFLCFKKFKQSLEQSKPNYKFDDLYYDFLAYIKPLIKSNNFPVFKTISGKEVEIYEVNSQDSIKARAKGSKSTHVAPLTQENLEKLYNKFNSVSDIKNLIEVRDTVEVSPRCTEFYAVFNGIKQFEQTYKPDNSIYEEEIQLDSTEEKDVLKKYNAGIYNDAIKKYGTESEPVVLILDEINRGNVSQIFGELITLIEDDKRIGKSESLEVILPYSQLKFGVPPNLYLIGTMNTADRSVEALDTALRRRFVFEEILPKYNLSELEYTFSSVTGKAILQTINNRIEKLLNKDHLIGHSYFILKYGENANDKLINSFYKNIIPLLQEYFFGDYGKIGLVLGQGFVKLKNWDDKIDSFAEFDHESYGDFEGRDIYEIIDYRENNTYEFNNIKMDFEKAIKLLMKIDIA